MKCIEMRLLLLFVSMAVWAAGCTSQECNSITDPQLTVGFARFTNAARTTEQNLTVAFSSIHGIGGSDDSSFISTTEPVGRVRLQLSQNADMTTFVFVLADKTTHTLTVAYTRQPFFISQACGFEMRFNDLTIVSHTFANPDDVVILTPAVTAAVNEVHIKIYY